MKTYIISVMAANRVGIVAAVSTAIDELGGNILELSQTVMRGFFTILLAAEFPNEPSEDEVADHMIHVGSRFDLQVSIRDADDSRPVGVAGAERSVSPATVGASMLAGAGARSALPQPPGETQRFLLTVTGRDRPGIVRQIASRLAEQGIDIVDLYAATGETEFRMVLELDVPSAVDTRALGRRLEQEGREVGLTAQLMHERIFIATNDPRPVRLGVR